MNKTYIASVIGLSLLTLGGCKSIPSLSLSEATSPVDQAPALAYDRVTNVDGVMINVYPSKLRPALQVLAHETGLKLRYDAEVLMHGVTGSLTGSAFEIAEQLTRGLPVRVYTTRKELVVEQLWSVKPGQTLKSLLEDNWDKKSAWSVVWETRNNQNLQAYAEFYGTFDTAVEQLFKSLQNDGSDIEPDFYPNDTVVIR